MFDLESQWTGSIVIIFATTLTLAIVSALAASFVDPDLPRSVREAAVSCWAVASLVTACLTVAVRHSN